MNVYDFVKCLKKYCLSVRLQHLETIRFVFGKMSYFGKIHFQQVSLLLHIIQHQSMKTQELLLFPVTALDFLFDSLVGLLSLTLSCSVYSNIYLRPVLVVLIFLPTEHFWQLKDPPLWCLQIWFETGFSLL